MKSSSSVVELVMLLCSQVRFTVSELLSLSTMGIEVEILLLRLCNYLKKKKKIVVCKALLTS